FKAWFGGHGDCQTEGVDFCEIWSPVVQWSTVHAMMVLSTKSGFCSAQADIITAFVHANLNPNEHIFIHQSAEFQCGQDLVLSLNHSVYGFFQAPRYFFQHLKLDPCLFVGKAVISLCYVDNILFYAPEDKQIDDTIHLLKQDRMMTRKESSAEGFLGVDVKSLGTPSAPHLLLIQAGLTKCIVEALGLYSSFSSVAPTPAETSLLPKDSLGVQATRTFNYVAVVGMLLNLCGHTHPDIAFTVHPCASYTFCPTWHLSWP
ncbi:hypothetical protein ACHAW6_000074, partial [Cyclotella cf. meneghiniana]